MIQHIVLFTPKPGLSDEVRGAFAALVTETLAASRHIARYSIGHRVDVDSGYPRSFGDKTYDYAAVLEFADRDSLVGYLNDSSHGRLGQMFWEYCDSCVVCEVEANASETA